MRGARTAGIDSRKDSRSILLWLHELIELTSGRMVHELVALVDEIGELLVIEDHIVGGDAVDMELRLCNGRGSFVCGVV